MKVSIVSSYDSGGAGIAARRLFESLQRASMDVELITKDKIATKAGFRRTERPWSDPIVTEFTSDFSRNRTPISDTLFSFLYPTPMLAATHLLKSDVVNIHWATDFFNLVDLRTLGRTGKPVVLTLHDEWSYTGGCHYTAGCTKFVEKCERCPQLGEELWHIPPLVLQRRRNYYGSKLQIVAPSGWIARQARSSSLFRNNPVEVIGNPIDLIVFKPAERTQARKSLKLRQDMKYVLTGSASNAEKRKGIGLFRQSVTWLLDNYPQSQKCTCILVVGKKPKGVVFDPRVQWRFLGDIESEETMAKVYSASDLFALPSIEDNLPNMMVESLACGTPVIGYGVGGIAETVVNGLNGFLCEARDTIGFARAMNRILSFSKGKSEQMQKSCRDFAEHRFGYSSTTGKYVSLYSRLAENKQGEKKFYSDSLLVEIQYEDLIAKYYRRVIDERDKTIQRMSSSVDNGTGRASTLAIRMVKRLVNLCGKMIRAYRNK